VREEVSEGATDAEASDAADASGVTAGEAAALVDSGGAGDVTELSAGAFADAAEEGSADVDGCAARYCSCSTTVSSTRLPEASQCREA
jgi:hypothetical protein